MGSWCKLESGNWELVRWHTPKKGVSRWRLGRSNNRPTRLPKPDCLREIAKKTLDAKAIKLEEGRPLGDEKEKRHIMIVIPAGRSRSQREAFLEAVAKLAPNELE